MRGPKVGDPRTYIVALFLVGIVVAGLIMIVKPYFGKLALTGLLIDLELNDSNPDRYKDLREALTCRLPEDVPELKNTAVRLDYVHFMAATSDLLTSREIDFVVLSPQSTPWHRYRGDAASRVDSLKADLRDLIMKHKKPVLGVCGGHQFLALAFGGTVDFIDPRFQGKYPERYPLDALSERGMVRLETLSDDPILRGVASFPGSFYVMESHYEEVKSVPRPFVNLARSDRSEAQLIGIPGLTVYGTAFHPERGWSGSAGTSPVLQSGRTLLANFLTMVMEQKSAARTR